MEPFYGLMGYDDQESENIIVSMDINLVLHKINKIYLRGSAWHNLLFYKIVGDNPWFMTKSMILGYPFSDREYIRFKTNGHLSKYFFTFRVGATSVFTMEFLQETIDGWLVEPSDLQNILYLNVEMVRKSTIRKSLYQYLNLKSNKQLDRLLREIGSRKKWYQLKSTCIEKILEQLQI